MIEVTKIVYQVHVLVRDDDGHLVYDGPLLNGQTQEPVTRQLYSHRFADLTSEVNELVAGLPDPGKPNRATRRAAKPKPSNTPA